MADLSRKAQVYHKDTKLSYRTQGQGRRNLGMILEPGFGGLIGFSLISILSEAVQLTDGPVDQEDFPKLGLKSSYENEGVEEKRKYLVMKI